MEPMNEAQGSMGTTQKKEWAQDVLAGDGRLYDASWAPPNDFDV